MGQIVKRKKKGRPSKADLALRAMVRHGSDREEEEESRSGAPSRVAFLTAAISSEIKAMVAAVEDGSGAGTTTCCGAPCVIV
ncbi:hypothetical protein FCV25MIE_20049 [Fagus crenata]